MKLKLFGKDIFDFSNNSYRMNSVEEALRKSKYLPDFYKAGSNDNSPLIEMVAINGEIVQKKDKKKKETKRTLTPKDVYELKLLHDETFTLNTNVKYIESQLEDFNEKLNLISAEEYDMRRGVEEISSIVIRLENRKSYEGVSKFYEQLAYTTTTKIDAVIKKHSYLKIGKIAQFIADMPKEATSIMKEYNKYTKILCGKQAVFYIIADKKDFEQTKSRRDPILLAQSPFGHFWQILGAWDEEMLFLEEL